MVNLVLPCKLVSQVETACQIDSPRENGMAEVILIIYVKSRFLYSTKIVIKKCVCQLLSLKYLT